MGSKSSAPPPDPRLAAAQADALNSQTEISKRTYALQESMAPLQREAMQFGLDSSKTAFQQSQEDRTYNLGKRDQLDAAMKPMLDEALNFNEGNRRAELAGQTSAEITKNFSEATGQQTRGLGRSGVTANAAQTGAMQTQSQMAEAKARSYAGQAVSTAAKQEGVNARANAVNMLSGSGAMASGLTTTGAQIGANAGNIVNSGVQGMNNGLSAAGQIFKTMGQQASSLWNEQSAAKLASDQANANSKSQMWGTVASVAMSALMMFSDRRLKRNVTRIGNTAKGVPMYRFQYHGSDMYFIGPMADEVEQIVPHAVRNVGGYKAVDYSLI